MNDVRRGRLKVCLGAAPGAGKTYRMLDEGRRRAGRGADVVVAFAECHGRPRTEALLGRPPRLRPDGGLTVGSRPWDVDPSGRPEGEIELRAYGNGHYLGRGRCGRAGSL